MEYNQSHYCGPNKEMKQKHNPFNARMLKQFHQRKIKKEMIQIPRPFCIYGETPIIQSFNFCFDNKFAQFCPQKVYSLEMDHEAIDLDLAPNVVYLLFPQPEMLKIVASMILKNQTSGVRKCYWLFFVPFCNFLCKEALKRLSILKKVQIIDFHSGLIPITESLYSLELCPTLDPLESECCVVESLLRMSNILGKFINCYGLGPKSCQILKNLEQEYEELPKLPEEQERSQSYLLVLDRSLDLITPMLTGFSYQSILDLFFGISFNQIQIPGSLMESKNKVDKFLLYNPKDKHYGRISTMAVHDVAPYLNEHLQLLGKVIKERKKQATSFQKINELNETLMPEYVHLQIHKNILNFILDKMTEPQFINRAAFESKLIQQPERLTELEDLSIFLAFEELFKLEVLSSQVSEFGSYYNRHEKKIAQFVLSCYDALHLLTVQNLLKENVLRNTKAPLKWKEICESYDLIPDTPHDYTHIHIMYSALLVRFVDLFLTQRLNPEMKDLLSPCSRASGDFGKVREGDSIYIYFVGGVTWGEVEGFKLLSHRLKLDIIICTTDVTNGRKIITSCFPSSLD